MDIGIRLRISKFVHDFIDIYLEPLFKFIFLSLENDIQIIFEFLNHFRNEHVDYFILLNLVHFWKVRGQEIRMALKVFLLINLVKDNTVKITIAVISIKIAISVLCQVVMHRLLILSHVILFLLDIISQKVQVILPSFV